MNKIKKPWATDPAAYSRHVHCMRARRRDTMDAWIVLVSIMLASICTGLSLAAFAVALVA